MGGGRAVVRGTSDERIRFLDTHLWTYDPEGFLVHGVSGGDADASQPILLGTGMTIPNGADTLFLIDGAVAPVEQVQAMQVTAILFDGHDPSAVEFARGQWREVTGAGLAAVYWARTDEGGWVKKSESPAK